MIETWASTGWRKIGKPILQRLSFLPVGGWITLLVILAVGSRFMWAKAKNERREKIMVAYGRAGLPSGSPQMSHDGKKITFVQIGENGLGVFLKDLASGKSQLIHQKGAKQDIFLTLQVWPWSPDDRFFIYSAENLTVCAAASGKDVAIRELTRQSAVRMRGCLQRCVRPLVHSILILLLP